MSSFFLSAALFILLVVGTGCSSSSSSSAADEVFELNIKDPRFAREIYNDLETKEGITFIGVLGPLSYLVTAKQGNGAPKRVLREGRYNVTNSRRRLLPPHWESPNKINQSRQRQRFIVQLIALKGQNVINDALPKAADPKWAFIGKMKYVVAVNVEFVNATRFLLSTSPWVATFDFVREHTQHGMFAKNVILSGGEHPQRSLYQGRTGEGVTVAVGDSGVDMKHPGFARFTSIKQVVYTGGAEQAATVAELSKSNTVYLSLDIPDGDGGRMQTDSGDEHNGHGTATTWLVAGDQPQWRSRVKLMVVDFMKGESQFLIVPPSMEGLLEVIYSSGARVFSNSWGSDSRGEYTFTAMEFDDFSWRHQDFVFVISAGNDGPDRRTVTSPAMSKNGIAVGASQNSAESFLSPEANLTSNWDRPEQRGFSSIGSCENLASFSSRGPTMDGRIKPDLVAPGQFILTARAKPAAGESDMHHMQGTSFSGPLVAQAVAELIEVFQKQFKLAKPTFALVKATLIGYALPLQGGVATMMLMNKTGLIGALFNNRRPLGFDEQGFGRLHLPPVVENLWVRDRQALDVFGQCVLNFTILEDREVTVTISWPEPPAVPYSNHRNLVNDFNLRVLLGPERVYLYDDPVNNVERHRFFARRGEEMIVIVSPRGPLTPYAGIDPTFSIAIHGAVRLLQQPAQPRCHPRAPPLQCSIGGEIGGRGCLGDGSWGPCRARCHQKGLFWINETTCGCLAPLPCAPTYEDWVRMRECLPGGTLAVQDCPTALPPKPQPLPRRRLSQEASHVMWIWIAVSIVVFMLFYAFHIRKRQKRRHWGSFT